MVLALYALKVRVVGHFSTINTWESLALNYGLDFVRNDDPNSESVIIWLQKQKVDVVISLVGHIMKKDLIQTPNLGIINKHASVLPSCKGLFPFFWAKVKDVPTGVSFHLIDEEIDGGKLLLQKIHPEAKVDQSYSMLRFYVDMFLMYPFMIERAIQALVNKKFCQPASNVSDSYFGLPSRSDYVAFASKGYKVARLSDLFYKTPSK